MKRYSPVAGYTSAVPSPLSTATQNGQIKQHLSLLLGCGTCPAQPSICGEAVTIFIAQQLAPSGCDGVLCAVGRKLVVNDTATAIVRKNRSAALIRLAW